MRTVRHAVPIALAVLAVAACAGADDPAAQAADTLTRAQKDSIISEMPIPGASGVGRALDASRAAGERAQQHDTIG